MCVTDPKYSGVSLFSSAVQFQGRGKFGRNHDGIAPRRPKPAKTNIINMVCFSTKALEKSSPSSSNSSLHVVAHPIDLFLWLEAAKSIHLLINGVLVNAGDCL